MDHYPGMPPASPPREGIAAIEEQLARYRRHATPGQFAFDFAFGLVAPALLLLADPALFTHHVAARSAFPPYAAVPGVVLAAVLGLFIVGYRDQARAFSFSIVYHASQWFPVTLVGFLYLMKEQLSLTQIGKISSRKDLEEAAPGAGEGAEGP